jgi:hypothetical protein
MPSTGSMTSSVVPTILPVEIRGAMEIGGTSVSAPEITTASCLIFLVAQNKARVTYI